MAVQDGYIVYHNTQDLDFTQLCINMSPWGNDETNQDVHGCIGTKTPQPSIPFSQPTRVIPLMVFFRTTNYNAVLIDWPSACQKLQPPEVATVTVIDTQGDYQINC